MTITEEQRRRADNQIWNAAGIYGFRPRIRAYDDQGRAELYWNSVIGACRKHYGEALESLFDDVEGSLGEAVCEQILWLGLEHACYEREAPARPAFPVLRQAYARRMLGRETAGLPPVWSRIWQAYFRRAAGLETDLDDNDRARLEDLAFSGSWNGAELAMHARAYLDKYLLLAGTEADIPEGKAGRFGFIRKRRLKAGDGEKAKKTKSVSNFGFGLREKAALVYTEDVLNGTHQIFDMSREKSDEAIARFVRDVFGTPLLDPAATAAYERQLCRGSHKDTHLYFAEGDGRLADDIIGYAGVIRRSALAQMEKNREYYDVRRDSCRLAIRQLTERIRHALLSLRDDSLVRAAEGRLEPVRVWRAELVNDDKLFERTILADRGDLTVDILIDSSLSQVEHQQLIAAQAYMAAQSLTNCGIPVRILAYSSLSGYTILTQYRDYDRPEDNERIFNYTTFGGNRDGLAIKTLGALFDNAPRTPEHRLVIVLSDAKPNDTIFIERSGRQCPYNGEAAVDNTAAEIRRLKRRGIAVVCIFTGNDDDLPSARCLYGRDFVRIRSLDRFAGTVGNLLITQLREFS